MKTKPFIKITEEDVEYARQFFEDESMLKDWIYNVVQYYMGNNPVHSEKMEEKYFNNYKKTMDMIIEAKHHGSKGGRKRAESIENNTSEEHTLEPSLVTPLEGGDKDPLVANNKLLNINHKQETNIPVDESTLHPLQKFVKDSYPNVSSLKTQLTKEQCERLLGEYTKDAIKTKLDAMENKPNLKKNYLAVYNTLNNWLSMERQRNPSFGKLPLTPEQELEILKKERGYHVD